MCNSNSEKLKNYYSLIKWLGAISVSTILYWFVATPLIYFYLLNQDKNSTMFKWKFWVLAFLIWLGIISAIWFIYIKFGIDIKAGDESQNLLTPQEEMSHSEKLPENVKKRLGITDGKYFEKKLDGDKREEKFYKSDTDINVIDEGPEQKKRDIMPRFSMINKDNTELDKSIIQLPDLDSEDRLSLLIPYGGFEQRFHGKFQNPIDDSCIVNVEDNKTGNPRESDLINDQDLDLLDRNKSSSAKEKWAKLRKLGSQYLLESPQNGFSSTSEIFFTVNESGMLVNKPIELGKFQVLKEL